MEKIRKVLKYGTGQEIPINASYLTTVIEEDNSGGVRLVWHYYDVIIESEE